MELINEIETLNRDNLIAVCKYLHGYKGNWELLSSVLGSVSFNNGYGTNFIEPINKNFSSMYMHIYTNGSASVGLIGSFELRFSDLVSLFGEYRNVYVPYDDHFMYFFNENSSFGYFCVSTFSENDIQTIKDWPITRIDIKLVSKFLNDNC